MDPAIEKRISVLEEYIEKQDKHIRTVENTINKQADNTAEILKRMTVGKEYSTDELIAGILYGACHMHVSTAHLS